jgi:hypothetical protein
MLPHRFTFRIQAHHLHIFIADINPNCAILFHGWFPFVLQLQRLRYYLGIIPRLLYGGNQPSHPNSSEAGGKSSFLRLSDIIMLFKLFISGFRG